MIVQVAVNYLFVEFVFLYLIFFCNKPTISHKRFTHSLLFRVTTGYMWNEDMIVVKK